MKSLFQASKNNEHQVPLFKFIIGLNLDFLQELRLWYLYLLWHSKFLTKFNILSNFCFNKFFVKQVLTKLIAYVSRGQNIISIFFLSRHYFLLSVNFVSHSLLKYKCQVQSNYLLKLHMKNKLCWNKIFILK